MKKFSSLSFKIIALLVGGAFFANLLKIVPPVLGFQAINLPMEAYGALALITLFASSLILKIFKFVVVFLFFTPLYFLIFKGLAHGFNFKLDLVMIWTLRTLAISTATLTYIYGLQCAKYLGYQFLMGLFFPVRYVRKNLGPWFNSLMRKVKKLPPCPIDIPLSKIDKFGNGDTYEQGRQFEEYVAQIYRVLGYNAKTTTQLRAEGKLPPSIQARGGSGEQGVDVIVPVFDQVTGQEQRIIIQCKHYSQKVGNSAVQEINSALALYNAQKAVVISNNFFTKQAIELAAANQVRLIDREGLEKLIANATDKYYQQHQERSEQAPKKLVA